MIKSNGGIIGPDNVTTGGAFGTASGVFKLNEVTDLIKDSKWPTAGPQGFQVANSVRMNRGSSDYFRRTNNTAGTSDKIGTYSGWVKRSTVSLDGMFFEGKDLAANNYTQIYFQATGALTIYGSGGGMDLVTTALFRDPSAWYHVVVAFDTTQGTASNRVKVYVNGVQQTSFATGTYLAQNATIYFGVNGDQQGIGVREDGALLWNGYMSEICYVDGQALAPTSFGETNSQTGIWIPKDVSGLTFGNNGCYLDFKDASNLGNVVAGNSTDFTENGLTSLDQSTDTCTTNFATLNSLDKGYGTVTYVEGNLKATSSSGWNPSRGTIAVTKGKWYWETMSGNSFQIGVCSDTIDFANNDNAQDLTGVTVFYNASGGIIRTNGSTVGSGTATFSASDTAGFALDMDNKKLSVYKNGSIIVTNTALSTSITDVAMIIGTTNGGGNFRINFGSPFEAISSGNADGNGFGNFEYAVPSGYYSLNTKNLAEYG